MKNNNLISISELIRRAQEAGFNFGKGNPVNRLRYYTKNGLIPHAQRKQALPGESFTIGYYPDYTLDLLLKIQGLKKSGQNAEKIAAHMAVEKMRAATRGIGNIREIGGIGVKNKIAIACWVVAAVVAGTLWYKSHEAHVTHETNQILGEATTTQQVPVAVLSEPVALYTTPNLLQNPGFEGGPVPVKAEAGYQPNGWQYLGNSGSFNTFVSNYSVRSGAEALYFKGISEKSGILGIYQQQTKTINGRDYVLSVWARSEKPATLRLGFLGGANQSDPNYNSMTPAQWADYAKDAYQEFSVKNDGSWQLFSFTYKNAALGKIPYVQVSGLNPNDRLFVDDVALTESASQNLSNSSNSSNLSNLNFNITKIGNNSVVVDDLANIYPEGHIGAGSLGMANHAFASLTLAQATIDNNGNLTANGTVVAGGDLTANAKLTVKDTASFQQSASISGSLQVYQNITTNTLTANSTASMSGGLTLYGTPTISTTAMQSLTLGDSSTGNIVLNSSLIGNGSTRFKVLTVADLPTGGAIGTAPATVDAYTTIAINQTTSSQTITLPTPSSTTAGRVVFVTNTGTAPFTILSTSLLSGSTLTAVWNGSSWTTSLGTGFVVGTVNNSILRWNSATAQWVENTGILAASNGNLDVSGLILGGGATGIKINSSGNVGVGTTAPAAKLEVNGDLLVNTYATVSASLGIGTSAVAGPGNLNMLNNLTVGGSTVLGTSTTNNLTVNGYVTSNFIPSLSNTYDLGSNTRQWNNVYANTVTATNLSGVAITGKTSSADWQINSANATADTSASTLTFNRGTATVFSELRWNPTTKQITTNATSFAIGLRSDATNTDIDQYSGKAALIVNQVQNQDLFTASASGTPKFVINNAGNVGIGTTKPLSSLGILGNLSMGATYGNFAAPTSGLIVEGNVGIGTTTPSAKLDVNGTLTVTGSNLTTLGGNLTVTGTAWTATPIISGLITATSGLTSNGTVTVNSNFLQTTAINNGFAGNVGIGTTVPLNKLDVNGSVAIGSLPTTVLPQSNMLYVSGNVGIGTTAPTQLFAVGSTSQFNVSSTGAIVGASLNAGSGTITTTGNGTFSTSVTTPIVDNSGTLTVGGTNATSISLGKTGVTTTNNGSLTSTQTLTASNGLTLTTGALSLTGTSGSLALTGFGTSSVTSTTATGNINTLADSSLVVAGGATGNLANLTFTNTSVNTTGTSTVTGLNIAGTNNSGVTSGATMETYGAYIQGVAGTLVTGGTKNNYGLRIGNYGQTGATTTYGLYLDNQTGGTTNYSLYSNGGQSYFSGNVGVGTTAPAYKLDVNGTANFASTVTMPTPFTLGVTSVTSTGTQLNYLNAATGTTGTTNTNLVFSTSPTLITPALGTPTALVLTNATGLPAASVLAGTFGTGAYTMDTSLTNPLLIGGTGVGSSLTLKSTSGVGSTDFIKFLVGNNGATEAMRITSGGNVGIGTTGPGTLLQVNRAADPATLGSSSAAADWTIAGYAGTGSRFYIGADATKTVFTSANSRDIQITPNYFGATGVYIQSGGNVGIGTTNPGANLDIAGTSARPILRLTALAAYNNPGVQLYVSGGSGNDRNWEVQSGHYTRGELAFFQSNTLGGDPNLGTARMLIDFNGNVGIGTTGPGYKLDVQGGDINTSGDVRKAGTAYTNPDYVLEKYYTGQIIQYANKEGAATYQGLMALPDLENFVKTNYHLPGFGQEAKLGLFSGGDLLLARTEELTLYMIENYKNIASQSARIDSIASASASLQNDILPDISQKLALIPQIKSDVDLLKDQMASVSAQLTKTNEDVSSIKYNVSSISGALNTSYIIHDTNLDIATISANFANFSDSLKVIGKTQLAQTSIGGALQVGLLHFDDLKAEISSLTGTVSILGDATVSGQLRVGKGIVLPDSVTGEDYCVRVASGAAQITKGECN